MTKRDKIEKKNEKVMKDKIEFQLLRKKFLSFILKFVLYDFILCLSMLF